MKTLSFFIFFTSAVFANEFFSFKFKSGAPSYCLNSYKGLVTSHQAKDCSKHVIIEEKTIPEYCNVDREKKLSSIEAVSCRTIINDLLSSRESILPIQCRSNYPGPLTDDELKGCLTLRKDYFGKKSKNYVALEGDKAQNNGSRDTSPKLKGEEALTSAKEMGSNVQGR